MYPPLTWRLIWFKGVSIVSIWPRTRIYLAWRKHQQLHTIKTAAILQVILINFVPQFFCGKFGICAPVNYKARSKMCDDFKGLHLKDISNLLHTKRILCKLLFSPVFSTLSLILSLAACPSLTAEFNGGNHSSPPSHAPIYAAVSRALFGFMMLSNRWRVP